MRETTKTNPTVKTHIDLPTGIDPGDSLSLELQPSVHSAPPTAPAPALAQSPSAPSDPPIDPITLSKIESLRRKQRADAFLQTLSDAESDRLFTWFEEFHDLGQVFQLVTAPPPKGLGRKVSITSLRRLRSHWN